jgi:hypothetical protein
MASGEIRAAVPADRGVEQKRQHPDRVFRWLAGGLSAVEREEVEMITYTPSYVLATRFGYVFDSRQPNFDYLPLWEHFARRALHWNENALECVNDTSGIHCYELQAFRTRDQVHKALARMFSCVGTDTTTGRFLAHCRIRKWSDLASPIRVTGWDRDVPFEQDVCERQMKRPGPNSSHPGAIFGQHCVIGFGVDRRWNFRLHYGYSRDSSSWCANLRQEPGESLHHFGQRIPTFLESLFEAEDWWSARNRKDANRRHAVTRGAVENLFWDEHSDRKSVV